MGNVFLKAKYRIKIFNTVNFKKSMQMGKKPSVTADLQSKKMQVAGEKKKEAQRECKRSETVI